MGHFFGHRYVRGQQCPATATDSRHARPCGVFLQVGADFAVTFIASQGTQPHRWTIHGGPAGMAIDAGTGELSWSPQGYLAPTKVVVLLENSAGTDECYVYITAVLPYRATAVLAPGAPKMFTLKDTIVVTGRALSLLSPPQAVPAGSNVAIVVRSVRTGDESMQLARTTDSRGSFSFSLKPAYYGYVVA